VVWDEDMERYGVYGMLIWEKIKKMVSEEEKRCGKLLLCACVCRFRRLATQKKSGNPP